MLKQGRASAADADFLAGEFTHKGPGVATQDVQGRSVEGRRPRAVQVAHLAVGPFPATRSCSVHLVRPCKILSFECISTFEKRTTPNEVFFLTGNRVVFMPKGAKVAFGCVELQ